MKKILILFCVLITALSAGCNVQDSEEFLNISDEASDNNTAKIYDIDNNIIGELEEGFQLWLVDGNIIHTTSQKGSAKDSSAADCYCYNIENKTSVYLGTIEDWEIALTHQQVLYNQHLYNLIVAGDLYDANKRELVVYDIDLNNKCMSKAVVIKGGFQYDTMTVANNKILITNLHPDGHSSIEEYDLETKQLKTVLSNDLDSENGKDVIRNITTDGNSICMMRVQYNSEEDHPLFLDYYDYDMNRIKSINLAPMFTNDYDFDETDQGVSDFIVSNDYLYYQNFSLTRFLGKIKDNTVERLIETNPNFNSATNADLQDNKFLFYQAYNDGTSNISKSNDLYLFDSESGSVKKCEFYADNKKYYFTAAYKSTDNHALLVMQYEDPYTRDALPVRFYYVDLSDLDFQDFPTE